MKAENYLSRLESAWGNDIVFTTDGRSLIVRIEGDDGRAPFATLTPAMVHELKAMIAIWEKYRREGVFD